MHYSQKRRYYFFIAIAKFKTILSYYPRWRKLPPCLSFAQPSLMIAPHLRHTCATLAPHLHHTCATHFGKLSEFAKVNQLPRWRKFFPPTAYPSSHTRLRQLADFPSSHTRLCQLADFPSSHTQLRQLANFPSSHTRLCQLTDFPSSHTQLRQLADFPSLILRLSFAYPSLKVRL